MRVERHYDDEALISLLETHADGADEHLPTCDSCSEKLESVRAIASSLKDPSVWQTNMLSEAPVPSTVVTLRAFADRIAHEDARAVVYVRDLLDGPRESWRAKLDEHPEYRTAGVVRKLIAEASRAVDTMPPDGLEMATLATEIVDGLDRSSGLRWDRLAQLRGAARRERAFALYFTGRFGEALVETNRADSEFAACVVADYERARLGIVKALVLRAIEQWTPAITAARESVRVFEEFDDVDRAASARLAEVHLLFSLRDFGQAITILLREEGLLRKSANVLTHALFLSNLGYAFWQAGKTAEGMNYYDAAIELFNQIGNKTEAVRIQWAVARMLLEAGQRERGLEKLRDIAIGFDGLGMACEAALATLDVAELILEDRKFDEVEEICRRAMRSFEEAGVSYTAKALTALAYMRESTQNRIATPKLVRHVRDYIRRLPAEESLLFAPPC